MRAFALAFALVLTALPLSAQNRETVEEELQRLQAQIEETQRALARTRAEESSALTSLERIDTEIALRETLVGTYRARLDDLSQQTERIRSRMARLEGEIGEARHAYRERARQAYMRGRSRDLALLLSAGSVPELIVRAQYLRRFAEARQRQIARIRRGSLELARRQEQLGASTQRTRAMLGESQAERRELASRRGARQQMVASLRSQRSTVEAELQQRQQAADALEAEVRRIVAAELRRQQEEERRRAEALAAEEAARVARAAEEARRAEAARLEAERLAAERAAAEEAARRAEARRQEAEADAAERARAAAEARRVAAQRRESEQAEAEAQRAREEAEARESEQREAERRAAEARAAEAEADRVRAQAAQRETAARERADREARQAEAAAAPPESEFVQLTGSFRQNRGRLPWPASGVVTGTFGVRTHPVYGTRTTSVGVDIATPEGSSVRSVYRGTVTRVGSIPAYSTYVMVTHGEYTTIYGNLSAVVVEQGQSVRAGQALGRAGRADARRGAGVFFALFDGTEPVNPVGWLGAR